MDPIPNGDNEREILNYQLAASGVPQQYWNTIIKKLSEGIFDAGRTFELLKVDYDEGREEYEPVHILRAKNDISRDDPQHIYLIDHFWTFRIINAKEDLKNPNLSSRLCNMLDLNHDSTGIEELFQKMWRLCNHYSIDNMDSIEQRLPIWYIMDEIGSAIIHSDHPNFRVIPFFYTRDQITYSLLFPIENVEEGEFISRDFAFNIPVNSDLRKALLVPYTNENFENIPFKPELPGSDYYLEGHIRESLPIIIGYSPPLKLNYKVFTEYDLIKQYLNSPQFEFVDNEEEADILWYTRHFKNFEELSQSPDKFVNQFPFEYVLTIKDLLCLTCRKSPNCSSIGFPKWLPITYNLRTEIANFFSYFNSCASNDDNYWIIKPFNLARSLDTHITNNLVYISKLLTTGPKIAQKYITSPVLFKRPDLDISVKFDVRYVVLLKSVKPLTAYIYKNFFLRFANHEFKLDNFDDYESHFTVMNYREGGTNLFHLKCAEFLQQWELQYPEYSWAGIEKSVMEMLNEILECAVKDAPPCGIAESPQSRAVYAADIILEWNEQKEIQPKILEINFTPDCERACQYYNDFYNKIFNLLFVDQESDDFLKL